MRIFAMLLMLCGCPAKKTDNPDPYKNVTPKKVKQQVEQIQQQEDERNDKRLDEAK